GAVYVYRKEEGSHRWLYDQHFGPSDASAYDHFGETLSVRQDSMPGCLLLVGAPRRRDPGPKAGAAFIFREQNGVVLEEAKLRANETDGFDFFGNSVSLSGDVALVGAPGADGMVPGGGSAYVFPASVELSLSADPGKVQAGDLLTLSTGLGFSGDPVMLAIVMVDGIPLFQRVALGSYGTDHRWTLTGTVPPGIPSLVATFQSFGLTVCGQVDASNLASVTFE
ncbi:MAG: FG-GAP repeat protein, partial [Planctomycetota bacterium]